MSRRYDREDAPTVPTYYRFPLRRPHLWEGHLGLAWDQCETWPTATEWLAWLRRNGPRRSYIIYGAQTMGRWVPRPRPIIHAHFNKWSTRRWGVKLP